MRYYADAVCQVGVVAAAEQAVAGQLGVVTEQVGGVAGQAGVGQVGVEEL